jgi:ribosomal silencing factor RsfS
MIDVWMDIFVHVRQASVRKNYSLEIFFGHKMFIER